MKTIRAFAASLCLLAVFSRCQSSVDVVVSRHGNPEEIRKVAIFKFNIQKRSNFYNRGSYYSDDRISDLLTHEFLKLGFDVVERSEIERLVKEQKLSVSGFIDPKEAVAIGRLSGADTIVTGTGTMVAPDKDVLNYLVIKVISLKSGSVVMTANLKRNMGTQDAVTEVFRSLKKTLDARALARKAGADGEPAQGVAAP